MIKNTAAFFYALFIYIVVVLFVFFKLYTYKDTAVKYTDMKNTFIDLELGDSIPKIQEHKASVKELFNQEALKQHISSKMKSIDDLEQKESNLNELFGKINYQESKNTKVQAAFKSLKKNSKEASNIAKKLDNLKENVAIVGQNKFESKAGVYDPFLGALRRILEQRWRLYHSSGDFTAKVHFTIDSDGYFYYDKVIYSNDEEFDKKLLNFLENIKGKYITLPPSSKPYSGILELSDKIK